MERFGKIDNDSELEASLTGAEDQVLSRLHRCFGYDGKFAAIHATIAEIQDEFSHCEAHGMYEKYHEGSVPRLDRMRASAEALKKHVDGDPKADEEDKQAAKELWLLVCSSLPGAVKRYVQSVITFAQQAPRFSLMGNEERREFTIRIDGERRRNHDALIKTIQDIDAKAKIIQELGAIPGTPFFRWKRGLDARTSAACPIFDASAIDPRIGADRDLIKNWAIAADFEQYMEKVPSEI